ncbi:DUF6932 family protein [uncultured Vagococcus sp.]|uniref:DUF6932 family protein n=1 Tax=uncultured Vagococcus sp. TaxID=189676 RepID=UPI0028D3B67E|nr:hypothetical protein [uncultured Vagococcus sp.]
MFDANGNYAQGIHPINPDQFEQLFVTDFTNSSTRQQIHTDLNTFLGNTKMAELLTFVSKIWLDGSFVTNKNNPNDIDGVIIINVTSDNASIINEKVSEISEYIAYSQRFSNLKIDFYVAPDPGPIQNDWDNIVSSIGLSNARDLLQNAELMYNYWKGKFTFDRNECAKGIFQILPSDINGGDDNE